MKTSLCALFLLCLLSLMAQIPAPDLQALRLKVAENPIDGSARLNLAYQLMLNSMPDQALKHYETLLQQDPQNVLAVEGILWALQSQDRFSESITRADEFLHIFPAHAPVLSYKAYGLSRLNLHLAARQNYAEAEQLAISDVHSNTANSGLAWEYLSLKNYPAAKSALARLKDTADPITKSLIDKTHLYISLGAGTNYQDKHSGNLSAAFQKAEWSLILNVEELILDSSDTRSKFGISAGWQSPFAYLEASLSRLNGEDKRVYPANQIGLSLKPVIYVGAIQLTPTLAGFYSSYERFDIQQADFGLQVASDKYSAGYTFSKLYHDNEAILSDSQKELHSFTIGTRIASQIWLSAYLYEGEQAWWTNPYGIIYDSFDADNRAYALSLSSPLGKKVNIMLYHQIGVQDHETQHSSFITLSYLM